MPFQSKEPTVDFVYVNKEDPDGKKGLHPFSWNLETEVVQDGNEGTPKETRRIVFGENGEPVRIGPDDPRYSVWEFAQNINQADRDAIDRKVSKSSFKFDRKKARKLGRDYSPEFESTTIMSAVTALLTTMSRGWRGLEFIIPKWWRDANGNHHSLAGRPAPCTKAWVEERHPLELAAAEKFCNDLYEPESDDEEEASAQNVTPQEYFPTPGESVDRSGQAEVGSV